MKKIILLFLILSLLTCNYKITSAAEVDTTISYTTLSDDSYFVTTIVEVENNARASTKSGKKTTSYYSSNNVLLWSVSVTGTFSYNGTSATCISASVSTTCPASNWKIASKSSSKSGARAVGTATAKKYVDNKVSQTVTKTVALTCSANGVLS